MPPGALDSSYEARVAEPAVLRLATRPSAVERTLDVVGARACLLVRDDGLRVHGCRAALPAGPGGVLWIERGATPLRALLFAAGGERPATLNLSPAPGAALPLAVGARLSTFGPRIQRTLSIGERQVVHLRATDGVCGLLDSKGALLAVDGLASGCEIDRLLDPGSYVWLVRPFGGRGEALAGAMAWSAERPELLTEGVGPERFVGLAATRLFLFTVASAGKVGLGMQAPADGLECRLLDAAQRPVGEGCQELVALHAGSYLLSVRARPGAAPIRFRPVLLGLEGAKAAIPDAYLQDFFQRLQGPP